MRSVLQKQKRKASIP